MHGGDGTFTHVASLGLAFGEQPIPPIAILGGGTMNVVAASLRIRERAIPFVRQLVETARGGGTFQTLRRRCLRIGDYLGFIFGNGLMANFLGEYYGTGKYGPARAAWLLLRACGSALIGGPFVKKLFKRFEGTLELDGQLLERTSFMGVGAATVREVGLGFKLNHRADDDLERFGFLAIHARPIAIIPEFVAVHRGKGVSPSRALSAVASTLRVTPKGGTMPYTIDGDLYRAQGPLDDLGRAANPLRSTRRCVDRGATRRYHGGYAMSSSFPLDGMRVRFAGDSNVGMKRAHNEDAFYLPESERLAIVADGMGGHASGEVASRMAVDTIVGFFKATQDDQQLTWPFKMDHGNRWETNRMVTAIKLANLKIHEQAQKDPRCHGMGTTVVSTLFADRALIIGHVGDSRLYRRREGLLKQLTEDHSLLNDYIKMKNLTADEIASFPHKNVIVRALGMKDTVQVDVHVEQPQLGDLYLLCSDGLSGMIKDEDISAIADAEQDLDALCEKLIGEANRNGGADNITVVAVRIEPA